MVYDRGSNRLIVFGGDDDTNSSTAGFNDVWVLSNANGTGGTPVWSQLAVGPGPPGIEYPAMVYDARSKRALIYGGISSGLPSLTDTWLLSNADGTTGSSQWTALAPSGAPPTNSTLNATHWNSAA